jgi:hypothetical protein
MARSHPTPTIRSPVGFSSAYHGPTHALPRTMLGLVTSRHLVTQAMTIVSEFGLRTYLRCVGAVLSGRRCNFLQLVC